MTVSDPIADILLGIIAAVLCLIAWHDLRGSVSLHRVMTNLTDSTQHASSRAEQLADAIATLPRRIAQQFPHAADAKVVPDTAPATKPAPTVTTEQLGAGMVPPATHAAGFDPARWEAIEAKIASLRDGMQPSAAPVVVTTTVTQPAPESTATPLVIADPTPGVVSPSVGAAA